MRLIGSDVCVTGTAPRVVLHVKLQFGDTQHSIMRSHQQLGEVIEEQDGGGRHTLIFTVQGAEGLLPHPSIQQALALILSDDAAIGTSLRPADDTDSSARGPSDIKQPLMTMNNQLMHKGIISR